MKVVLVHDYLIRFGGAERVLLELCQMFPEAPIYTFLYDEQKMSFWFPSERVQTSFLQKFPKFWRARHKYLLPFLPVAAESFDLREFDLVISSSSAFAKGVVTRPKTVHISYCHNSARFLWDYSFEYLGQQNLGTWRKIIIKILMSYLRLWDRAAAQRVDYFVANSKATAARIWKYYRKEAKVIYPPVQMPEWLDLASDSQKCLSDEAGSESGFQKCKIFPSEENFTRQTSSLFPAKSGGTLPAPRFERFESHISSPAEKGYFLIVSQLTPYKKIDVAIEAFNKLALPFVIIGEGPQEAYLKKIAKSNVQFLGWQPDEVVAKYYQNCLALIFPGEDDFGMAPVEAMSYGKPVLAYKASGAMEIILPGITGEFFEAPVPEILADGVRRLRENLPRYSPLVIRKWAEKFSTERFRREMMDFIGELGYN